MNDTTTTQLASPVGTLVLSATPRGLVRLHMVEDGPAVPGDGGGAGPGEGPAGAVLARATEQLAAYFAGDLVDFDVDLDLVGTPFQRRVWSSLRDIPYGQTRSYAAIAGLVGNPKACRAVGLANGRNPVGIIVPCHRVIGADGRLTGYAGGLHRKEWLLAHEQRVLGRAASGPGAARRSEPAPAIG